VGTGFSKSFASDRSYALARLQFQLFRSARLGVCEGGHSSIVMKKSLGELRDSEAHRKLANRRHVHAQSFAHPATTDHKYVCDVDDCWNGTKS
jgi:hypothetical protein